MQTLVLYYIRLVTLEMVNIMAHVLSVLAA